MSKPEISVVTPQFERGDGREPKPAPESREDFEALRELPVDDLLDMGLRKWDDSLLLFPAEWYDHIPEGFEVTTILDETKRFDPDTCSNDRRFGVLAYGIEVDA